jgi:enoyl-CoA hydratase
MTCDTRIGARGEFRLSLPETAIGMDLPAILVELAASRIPPQHLTRAAIQSEVYSPDQAVAAGFLDEVVAVDALDDRTRAVAERLAQLPRKHYAANKLAVRSRTLQLMKASLDALAKGKGKSDDDK